MHPNHSRSAPLHSADASPTVVGMLDGDMARDVAPEIPPLDASRKNVAIYIWATTLLATAAILASAMSFYWQWSPHLGQMAALQAPLLALVGLTGAWGALIWSGTLHGRQLRIPALFALIGALLMATVGIRALLHDAWMLESTTSGITVHTMLWLLTGWTAIHATLGSLLLTYCTAKCLLGSMDALHDTHMQHCRLYWTLVVVTAWITAAVAGLHLILG